MASPMSMSVRPPTRSRPRSARSRRSPSARVRWVILSWLPTPGRSLLDQSVAPKQERMRRHQTACFLRELRRSVALDPRHAEARKNLGKALCEKGLYDEAIAQFRAGVELKPADVEMRLLLTYSLIQKGNTAVAILVLREALRLDPNNEEAHGRLGYALSERGEVREAVREYRTALQLNPADAYAHFKDRKSTR